MTEDIDDSSNPSKNLRRFMVNQRTSCWHLAHFLAANVIVDLVQINFQEKEKS